MSERHAYGPAVLLSSGAAAMNEGSQQMSMDQQTEKACHQCGGQAVALARTGAGGWAPACQLHRGQRRAQPGAPPPPQQTSTSTTIPPMPSGEVTLGSARVHLARHLPGFSSFSCDAQFHACGVLRDLAADPAGVKMGKQAAPNGKPTVLLACYPGPTRAQRAFAYLASTAKGWDKLKHQQRWELFEELRRTANLVDVATGDEAVQ
jgi:hypothetical protein